MTLLPYVFPKLEKAKDVGSKMSKKLHFRILFDTQHAKGSQTLLKFAQQQNLSWKMSLLVISES